MHITHRHLKNMLFIFANKFQFNILPYSLWFCVSVVTQHFETQSREPIQQMVLIFLVLEEIREEHRPVWSGKFMPFAVTNSSFRSVVFKFCDPYRRFLCEVKPWGYSKHPIKQKTKKGTAMEHVETVFLNTRTTGIIIGIAISTIAWSALYFEDRWIRYF